MTAQLWVVNELFKFISISSFIQLIQLRSIMSKRSNSLENNLFYFTISSRKIGLTLMRTVHHMYGVIWQNDRGTCPISVNVIIGVIILPKKGSTCVTNSQLETHSNGLACQRWPKSIEVSFRPLKTIAHFVSTAWFIAMHLAIWRFVYWSVRSVMICVKLDVSIAAASVQNAVWRQASNCTRFPKA